MPVINSLLVKREGSGDSLLPIPPDVEQSEFVRCWDIIDMNDNSVGILCATLSEVPQPDELVYFYNDSIFTGYKPLPGLSIKLWEDGPTVPFIGWIKVSRFVEETGEIHFKVDNLGEIPYIYGVEV